MWTPTSITPFHLQVLFFQSRSLIFTVFRCRNNARGWKTNTWRWKAFIVSGNSQFSLSSFCKWAPQAVRSGERKCMNAYNIHVSVRTLLNKHCEGEHKSISHSHCYHRRSLLSALSSPLAAYRLLASCHCVLFICKHCFCSERWWKAEIPMPVDENRVSSRRVSQNSDHHWRVVSVSSRHDRNRTPMIKKSAIRKNIVWKGVRKSLTDEYLILKNAG